MKSKTGLLGTQQDASASLRIIVIIIIIIIIIQPHRFKHIGTCDVANSPLHVLIGD